MDGLADKPGFVSPVRYRAGGGNHPSGNAVTGALKRPTRTHRASSPQTRPVWPCSGWGLPSRSGHPERWWSLTPPFHPYRQTVFQADHRHRRFLFCGTGLRVSPSGRYPPPCSAEPGLSSVAPSRGTQRDRLANPSSLNATVSAGLVGFQGTGREANPPRVGLFGVDFAPALRRKNGRRLRSGF